MAAQAEEFKSLGNLAFKEENYEKAVELYTKCIELNSSESNYFSNRALAYLRLKEYKNCISDCLKSLNLNPDNIKALMHISKCYIMYGDLNQALNYLSKADQLKPKDSEIINQFSIIDEIRSNLKSYKDSLEQEQYSQALYYLGKVENYTHEQPDILIKKLEILVLSGQTDQALGLASSMLKTFASNPEFLVIKGKLHHFTGAPDIAKKHFLEALRLDPDYNPAKVVIRRLREIERLKEEANKLFSHGDIDGAIESYSKLLLQEPSNKNFNSTILANRSAAFMKKSDYTSALTDINESIKLNPDYIKAYMRRGHIFTHLGQFKEAFEDYELVKQKDPHYPELDNSIRLTKLEEKKSKRKNYYKILGVEQNATSIEIKKAYKKMALQNHPDKNSETEEKRLMAEQKFKDIGEAYTILSNPEKRQRYDAGEDISEIEGGGGGHDPSEVFRMFFGGGGGGHHQHFRFG